MSSFEIMIWRFKYSNPREIKAYEIIISFTIPDVDKKNESIIMQCAYEAAYVASGTIRDNVNYCANINESCMTNIENATALASKKANKTYHDCLRQFGMYEEMIRACEVSVFVRESII